MTRTNIRLAILAVLALFFCSVAPLAHAQDVTVVRHVTVRAEPDSKAQKVDFPAIGTALTLLDDGAQQRGYYHVRLPDGREGWVYRTFVARSPEKAAFVPDDAGDRVLIHFINVDQGNAALLEFPCGAVLIDAGGRGAPATTHLLAYLDAFFARRADLRNRLAAVFITHTHIDHNSNLRALVNHGYQVGAYIHNGILSGSGRANAGWMANFVSTHAPRIPSQAITQQDVEQAGAQGLTSPVIDPVACARVDPKIRVLSGGRTVNPGWSEKDFTNGNNHSVVIRVDYGAASFLFPGDLEDAGIADLIRRYAGTSMLDADVLEVSHHGAVNGTNPPFVNAVSPKIAVISMGPSTIQDQWTAYAYGHPRAVAVNALYAAALSSRPTKVVQVASAARAFQPFRMDKAIYATGWDGDIVLTADPQGRVQVHTVH